MIKLWCGDCCGDGEHSYRVASLCETLTPWGREQAWRTQDMRFYLAQCMLTFTWRATTIFSREYFLILRSNISKCFIRSEAISSISRLMFIRTYFPVRVAEQLIEQSNSSSSAQSQLPVLSYTVIKSSCVDLTGENILSSQPEEIKRKHYSVQSKH